MPVLRQARSHRAVNAATGASTSSLTECPAGSNRNLNQGSVHKKGREFSPAPFIPLLMPFPILPRDVEERIMVGDLAIQQAEGVTAIADMALGRGGGPGEMT